MVKSFKFEELQLELINLWSTCSVSPHRLAEVNKTAKQVRQNKDRYQKVAETIGSIPWYVVGIIHSMEAGLRFDKHLHNGDPLTSKTVQVPKGRPLTGKAPYTWEQSAVDALKLKGLHKVAEWPVERCLYELERYNGWGYRLYHPNISSPYLWSYTDNYTKGKYVADGKWDASAVSRQCGAAALLKVLSETAEVDKPQDVPTTTLKSKNTGLKVSVGTIFTAMGAGLVQAVNNPYALVFMLGVLGVASVIGYRYLKRVRTYIETVE
jgi:lysozyme family protein